MINESDIFLEKNDLLNQIILKIGDFGFAKRLPKGRFTQSHYGSPFNLAPEI